MTTPFVASAAWQARMLRDTDYFRMAASPGVAKEWQHFLILDEAWTVLVNFNLAAGPGATVQARTIAVAHGPGGAWAGGVATVVPETLVLRPGAIDARFGASSLRFVGGAYQVEFTVPGAGLRGELVLRPLALPMLSHHIALAPGREIHWLLVPRLVADGWIEVDARRHAFTAAPAYHDHNWGTFAWGEDFAWEWGCALPGELDCPWTAVFVRMADRRRHRARSQALLLWRHDEHCRFFRDHELRVRSVGAADLAGARSIPPVMALLAPGVATDIPASLEVEAAADGGRLRLEVRPRALTRVIIPDEVCNDRTVALNEVLTIATLTGTVRGEAVTMEGRGVFEFMRG